MPGPGSSTAARSAFSPPAQVPPALLIPLLIAALSLACVASPKPTTADESATPTRMGGRRGTSSGPAGSGGNSGSSPLPVARGPLLPARIRRLSNDELSTSIAALLPGAPVLPLDLPLDARQSQFTANAAQSVDPLFATQLQEALAQMATTAAPTLVTAAGCSAGDPCAQRFIADFVGRAWRRPLAADEQADLLEVFHAGVSGTASTFTSGIALVVAAALQSASFLYLTELGPAAAPRTDRVTLSPYEIAAALAYLVTGGPPDGPLLDAAARGDLGPDARAAQARRLFARPGAQHQIQHFVSEWLGLDRLATTNKDGAIYPDYLSYQPLMMAESEAFITEVIFHDQGTLARMLTADYTVAEGALARYYGLATSPGLTGRSSFGTGPRRGLLTQGTFLAVHAHPDSSAPVKRGVAVLDRLLCLPLPRPSSLQLSVLPPKPDPARTTRARFDAHSRDPACAGCHTMIDPIGDAFEGFDGMGVARTQENMQPVITSADLNAGPLVGHVDDAAALVDKLAASPDVGACFARNFFRFAAATSDDKLEAGYLAAVWAQLPADRQGSVIDLIESWAASDMFVTRAVLP
jgi:hypothetical protein